MNLPLSIQFTLNTLTCFNPSLKIKEYNYINSLNSFNIMLTFFRIVFFSRISIRFRETGASKSVFLKFVTGNFNNEFLYFQVDFLGAVHLKIVKQLFQF